MNYLQYYPIDMINGEGTRCTLFVAGCEHQCKGCYNQKSWKFNAGRKFDHAMQERIIADLQDQDIPRQGLSLSGGEPLHPHNISCILNLVKEVKQRCPNKDIWLWTGYTLAELSTAQQAIINYIDVLIDGKFIQHLASKKLIWRGSSNQLIHYLK